METENVLGGDRACFVHVKASGQGLSVSALKKCWWHVRHVPSSGAVVTVSRVRSRLQISYGHRAFWVAGPTAWNSLSDFIRDSTISADCFRRLLKTYLFDRYAVHSASSRFLTIIGLLWFVYVNITSALCKSITYLLRPTYLLNSLTSDVISGRYRT